MTTEAIKIIRDGPKGLNISLVSGKTISVPHPDQLFIPTYRTDVIIIEDDHGLLQIVDVNNIEEISYKKPQTI